MSRRISWKFSIVKLNRVNCTDMYEELILNWLQKRLDATTINWLQDKRKLIASGAPEQALFTAFSSVPRYLGKADLALTPDELMAASAQCQGWNPGTWTVDQAGRTVLLLAMPSADAVAYQRSLEKLFQAADVRELITLYQALPLLAHPEIHCHRATEGVRSHITSVFQAIALYNPYPAHYFDENAWNQLVLKSLFMDSPLYPMVGFDRRANPTLARMLIDYAHERWAAGRTFNPELWRAVGPFAAGAMVEDLARAMEDADPRQQQAAALAAAQSADPQIQALLSRLPDVQTRIHSGELTWESFSQPVVATPVQV